jgi:hypothetical protein
MDIYQHILQFLFESIQRQDSETSFDQYSFEDWETFLVLSEQHHVTAILYQHFQEQGNTNKIPDSILNKMNQANLNNAVSNTLLFHEAELIFSKLCESSLPAIGLKGLYLIENAYKNFGLRSMSDMDILLKKTDIPEALDLLEAMGYRLTTYFNIDDQNLDIKHVPPLVKGDDIYLEIHWTLLEENEPFSIGVEGLWERAIPIRVGNLNSLGLSHEDLLLHLCMHLTYQHQLKLGLRGLYDIALVLKQNENNLDWGALARRAKEWRADRVVALTFSLIEMFFPSLVPDFLFNQQQLGAIPGDILDQAKAQILNCHSSIQSVTPDLAKLSKTRGLLGKGKVILERVFLPKQVIARIYNVDPRSIKIYLYYPVRFWELLHFYAKSVMKILSNDNKMLDRVDKTEEQSQLREWLSEQNQSFNPTSQSHQINRY